MRRLFSPRFVRRVILFVSISLCLIAGGLAADPKQAPIEIGAVHNLTGAFGSIGGPSLRGAMLAVTKLNAKGGLLGRRVELVARDGRSDPAAVAAITREFVRMPGMSAITGLNDTTMALAAAPIAEKGRMVFLTSGATSPLVPLQFPGYYFMTCFGDNTQAAPAPSMRLERSRRRLPGCSSMTPLITRCSSRGTSGSATPSWAARS